MQSPSSTSPTPAAAASAGAVSSLGGAAVHSSCCRALTCKHLHTQAHTRAHERARSNIHFAHQEHKRCAMRMEEWKIEDKGGSGASPFKWADQRTTSRLNLSNGSTGAGSHTRPHSVPAALDPNYKERERELAGSDPMRLRAMLPHELPKKVQVLAAEAFLKGSTISQGLNHVGEKGDG